LLPNELASSYFERRVTEASAFGVLETSVWRERESIVSVSILIVYA
jgi:hypothetical protein